MGRSHLRGIVVIMGVLFVFGALVTSPWAQGDPGVRKALLVIARQGFRDEELQYPKEILEAGGLKVVIASSSLRPARGMLGAVVKPDILLSQVKVKEYEAVVFVGGMGAREYWHDSTAHRVVRETVKGGKVVGAICIAPVILAEAGVLSGKRATAWSGVARELRAKGAIYTGKVVQVDGRIITANGPLAAKAFGQAILKALEAPPSPRSGKRRVGPSKGR